MLAGMSLGTDLKRYSHGVLPRLALITIIVLPLLYGAMYLWAFWDPFNKINQIPVALVDLDRGTTIDNKTLHAGQEVTDALVKSHELNLHVVSAHDASYGVAHGTYYFSITLPEDFSQAIASPISNNLRQANIEFRFNDANNYLASLMGQNIAREVLNQVSAKVGQQVIGTALTGVADGIDQASDGATQIADGATKVHDGVNQVNDGAQKLADNLAIAKDGSAKIAQGTHQLVDAINTATEPLLQLTQDIDDMHLDPTTAGEIAEEISNNVRDLTNRLTAMNINFQQANGMIEQVIPALQANPDPAVRGLGDTLSGAHDLMVDKGIDPSTDSGLEKLQNDSQKLQDDLSDPNSKFRTGLTKLLNSTAHKDILALRQGSVDLDHGVTQLHDGLIKLTDGSNQLHNGTTQLAAGSQQLANGAHTLADKLGQAAQHTRTMTSEQRLKIAQLLASPVSLNLDFTHHAPTFGTGFAPFFFSLALFVGALITWMLLTPIQTRAIASGLGPIRVVLASYWPAMVIGLTQVVLMYGVVHFGVGLKAHYPFATIAFLVLVSATFLALIQALNAVFGLAVGRAITLAFLMFQLVSSGGVYPVETTAKPFQTIHPLDPMTYTVNGLRQLTVGGIDSRLWIALGILLTILITSLATSAITAHHDRQFTLARLYPPVDV